MKKQFYNPICPFCGNKKCYNCPLPNDQSQTLRDIVYQYSEFVNSKKAGKNNGFVIGDDSEEEEKGNNKPINSTIDDFKWKNDGLFLTDEGNNTSSSSRLFVLELFFN